MGAVLSNDEEMGFVISFVYRTPGNIFCLALRHTSPLTFVFGGSEAVASV
jgi:hypothetical protein